MRLGDVGSVAFDVATPFGWNMLVGCDGVDRARFYAGVAGNALLGINAELLGRFEVRLAGRGVDAVDRTDLDARRVFGRDAGLVEHVGHPHCLECFHTLTGKLPSPRGLPTLRV
jgi:hypothetical protein